MALMTKNTIYINNLNEKIKIQELKKELNAIFCQFGSIIEIVAHKNLKMRGQAFVAFADPLSACNALKSMQGFPFHRKIMRIQYAKKEAYCIQKKNGTYVEQPRVSHSELKKKMKADSQNLPDNQQLPPGSLPGVPPGSMVKGLVSNVLSSPARFPAPIHPPAAASELPPNKILFLTSLPTETDERILLMLFNKFPGFKEVRLVPNRHDIAFVEFENEILSAAAKDALQGFKITPSHAIKITFAKK